MNYLFIDTETGSLDPHSSDILQLAWILTDEKYSVIKKADHFMVPIFPITQNAFKVNGLTEEFLRQNAEEPEKIYGEFIEALTQSDCIVGHHVSFDDEMIKADSQRRLQSNTTAQRIQSILETVARLDTKTAYISLNPFWKKRTHPGPYLDELCRFLGVKTSDINFHHADGDTEALRRCLIEIKSISDSIPV